MLRSALLMMVLTVACSPDARETPRIDARDDAPADGPPDAAGSGSAAAFAMEPSPHDGKLELMVVALGLVIAAGPARGLQRRRDAL